MAQSLISRLEQHLWPKGYRRDVWMIVDSARDRRIYELLLESYFEYSCLYSGPLPPGLEGVAPYLLQLEYEDPRTQRFLERAWGRSWGIFLKCDTRLQTLRKHLRRFLTVRGPDGGKLLFRYYDPRVMRVYLPSCSSEELRNIFGPIERFWMEGEGPRTFLEFGIEGNKLARNELLLDGSESRPMLTTVPGNWDPPRPQSGPVTIRKEQFSIFRDVEVQKFENWVASHLKRFFPAHCRQMGEAKLRETIQYGIERAAFHGFRAKRDVCKYIDVMIVLGRDFDRDKAWAAAILMQQGKAAVRMGRLLETAKHRLRSQ